MDFAAEQVRQFAADRKAEAGAAILAAGRGVGLLEGFEDDLLLFQRNADAGIGHLERHHRRSLTQHRMGRAPAARRRRHGQPDAALRGELERIGQQIFQHLLQALGIGGDGASEIRIEMNVERQLTSVRFMTERPRDHVEHIGEEDLFRIHGDRAGLDLRQIQDIADKVQEVGAGAMNGPGELDLLARQIAFRIVGQLLAKDQDRVERRPQLVRHVGEEFRLVFRSKRQLGRFFLKRAARLLDFLVLALDFNVAFRELLRLLLKLLVGLLQLLLLRLQFAGELLRLLEQAFGLHRRLDRIEHDADRGRELFEEHDLQRSEFVDRGKLDHRFHLAFEQHRQDDVVTRRRP